MKEEVMKRKKQQLRDDEVRVIKIGEEALFEFIYEKFIDEQSEHLDVDPLSVTNSFSIDWENRQFLFCAHKTEDAKGEILTLPQNIDFDKLFEKMPNTTDSMYGQNKYQTYTKNELEEMCK